MTDGYLSRDKGRIAELQRKRRARMTRIDYMPGREALRAIDSLREKDRSLRTNSEVVDAIVLEWAELTGINYNEIQTTKTLARRPALSPSEIATLMTLLPQSRWKQARMRCGAKRHRDGEPCRALSEPGKKRCRFHGGRSTGPRTPEGKAKVARNLIRSSI